MHGCQTNDKKFAVTISSKLQQTSMNNDSENKETNNHKLNVKEVVLLFKDSTQTSRTKTDLKQDLKKETHARTSQLMNWCQNLKYQQDHAWRSNQ